MKGKDVRYGLLLVGQSLVIMVFYWMGLGLSSILVIFVSSWIIFFAVCGGIELDKRKKKRKIH